MRFIDDHQVPRYLSKAGKNLGAFGKVQRRDDLLLLQPLVDAELVANVAALQDKELLVEFLLQLSLPLERQVRRANHEHPFGQSAEL